jgi:2-(1,2-epoxy-1,2-dihydrophenyl)acetyl-CoA isomerase
MLPRLIGMQKAMALMMTGEKVMAPEAEKMNMIYKALPDTEFNEYVSKFALQLAQMPTKGLGLTKRAMNQSYDQTLEEQLKTEEILQTEAGQTHDFKEGVTAFLEKRPAQFKGN